MNQSNFSRRFFIRRAGSGLAAAAVGLASCAQKEIVKEVPVEITREIIKEMPVEVVKEISQEIPESPWTYVQLDVETVRKKRHAKYYEGD